MTEKEAAERANVVKIARTYMRTPYMDAGRVRGAGVDCCMLVAEVFREAFPDVVGPVEVEQYHRFWYLSRREHQRVIEVIERYARKVERAIPLDGDIHLSAPQVLHFNRRMDRNDRTLLVSHAAIVDQWPRVIHAWQPSGKVEYADADGGPLAATFVGIWSVWDK